MTEYTKDDLVKEARAAVACIKRGHKGQTLATASWSIRLPRREESGDPCLTIKYYLVGDTLDRPRYYNVAI